MPLSERKKLILKAVVEHYIETAEPVSSKAVTQKLGLMFSSATVRNEMAELEEIGYLIQPHTSAGRVPTHAGYRFYVDSLMRRYDFTIDELRRVNTVMQMKITEFDRIVSEVGNALSSFTGFTGVTSLNSPENGYVKKFEIVPIEDTTLVLILMRDDGVIKNVVIKTKITVDEEYIDRIRLFLNKFLAFKSLKDIIAIKCEIDNYIPPHYYEAFKQIIDAVISSIKESEKENLFLKGMSNILGFPEYHDVSVAKPLMDFMSDSGQMTKMLSSLSKDDGINISIGEENEAKQMKHSSVLVTTYNIGEHPVGLIGIVGPTRMNYSKMVTSLDYFAKGLSRLLGEIFSEDEDE